MDLTRKEKKIDTNIEENVGRFDTNNKLLILLKWI